MFPPPDFESGASTNSATGALIAGTIMAQNQGSTVAGELCRGLLWHFQGRSGAPMIGLGSSTMEPAMNEEALNMSLRKFLKVVGVTSQQEIEKAIRAAVADGRLKGNETIQAQMVLT